MGIVSPNIYLEVIQRITPLAELVQEADLKAFVSACKSDDLERNEWLERLAMIVASKAPLEWSDEDFGRCKLRLDMLAATMRRIEGLYGAQAPGAGFEAVRMTMTTASGADQARVIWLGGAAQQQLNRVALQMLAEADKLAGQAGREQLLAILAKAVLGGHANGSAATNGTDELK